MNKILTDNGRMAGTVFAELDANFLNICNALIKFANPDLLLKGYADPENEPDSPSEDDCYLVIAAGSCWSLTVEVYHIIRYTGSAWEIMSYKLTELNSLFQSLFFKASEITCTAPTGMTATNLQDAIDELAAAVFP